MALKPADMESCEPKKRCLQGVNAGVAYTPGDECSFGQTFSSELCDCVDNFVQECSIYTVTRTYDKTEIGCTYRPPVDVTYYVSVPTGWLPPYFAFVSLESDAHPLSCPGVPDSPVSTSRYALKSQSDQGATHTIRDSDTDPFASTIEYWDPGVWVGGGQSAWFRYTNYSIDYLCPGTGCSSVPFWSTSIGPAQAFDCT